MQIRMPSIVEAGALTVDDIFFFKIYKINIIDHASHLSLSIRINIIEIKLKLVTDGQVNSCYSPRDIDFDNDTEMTWDDNHRQ